MGPAHLWLGAWPGSWLLHGMMGRRLSYFGVCYPFLSSRSIFSSLLSVLGIEFRALCMHGPSSATKLQHQSFNIFIIPKVIVHLAMN